MDDVLIDNPTTVISVSSSSNLTMAASANAATSSMGLVEGAASEAEFDVYVYLSNFYGPQRQPPEKLIPLTIVYIGERWARLTQRLGLGGFH